MLTPPAVSYVMPVLNEERHLDAAVASILSQDYPGESELILALGASSDGTSAIASRLAAQDARVRLVDNPVNHIAAGLNLAIGVARHPVIVRVDAHVQLPPGYTATMVGALERTGAAVVGGLMDARGDTPFQRAVARAYNSPIGLGGGAYHGSEAEGEIDSAYLGVFDRAIFDVVGGYDETLLRGEDWELTSRIRAAGRKVWLVPSVRVAYWPRESADKLRRQMFATGAWRGELVRRQGRTPLRYLAPPALVVGCATAPVSALALATRRPPAALRAVLALSAAAPLLYLAGLGAASARLGGDGVRDHARNVGALATIHTSWGLGFLRGWACGAASVVDSSRVRRR
mgnify:CR=1 FL=1